MTVFKRNGTLRDAGPHLPISCRLNGRYTLERVLEWQGYEFVYLAWDEIRRTKVVVRELFPSLTVSRLSGLSLVRAVPGRECDFTAAVKAFLCAARRLEPFKNHPHLAVATDFFEANGTAYWIKDYLQGQTLRHGKNLSWRQVVLAAVHVLGGLQALHRENLLHGDVTPDNIYLNNDGYTKLIGLSNVRYYAADTNPWLVFSRGYSPPEYYSRHGKLGPWSDIYSLGATLYAVLAGKAPQDALDRGANDGLQPLSALRIPRGLAIIVHTALELQPEARFATAEDMQKALQALLQ